MRVAGAPISWGVCEVPGWGHQLDPDRVLGEMRELGLTATELGPDGYLSAEILRNHEMRAIGGFVPLVLHQSDHDPLPGLRELTQTFADDMVVVLAAVTGQDGYDTRPTLDAGGWRTLLGNLDRIAAELPRTGVKVALHPHVGTMVETAAEVRRVLDGSGIGLCLDTGHLLIGGTDPLDLALRDPGRITHAHLKDVDSTLAAQVQSGTLSYTEAVKLGIYRPLGQGDIDISGIISSLTKASYDGWYVMEQDVILTTTPPPGTGPITNVHASLTYLRGLP
ncbi:inosose dehydratase [Acrocarpospora phusangensis]|uniref:Inosose dehydratase n=1 Tax=Acrocarpospora phusangensis TaxID=1070424 RepID=A0A919UPM6_9ACTN|nr:sugar phosphate isomerase/epimerase [Acrocarpospora phusangensis]GIH28984.1 inosose dehydratase [Acrocarpospora phusangensis]